MGRILALGLLSLILWVLASCAPGAPPSSAGSAPQPPGQAPGREQKAPPVDSPRVQIKFPYTAVGGVMAPLWVANDSGIFDKYGIEAEVYYIPGGPDAVKAILAGELAVAMNDGSSVAAANVNGADIVMVLSFMDRFPFSLLTTSEIRRVEDLRGKQVGVTRYGTATDFAARVLLPRYGLHPEQDVAISQMGGLPEIVAGLHTGAIHGGMLSPPTSTQARKAGFRELLNLMEMDMPFQHTGVMTTRRYVQTEEHTLRRILRALVEATHLFKTNKELGIATIAKYARMEDRELLEETWDVYSKAVQNVPMPTAAGMKFILDQMAATVPTAANADPATIVETKFVREFEQEGLFRNLYGR